MILLFYGVEVFITALDLIFTQKHIKEDPTHHTGVAAEAFRTELEYWQLDVIQITLSLLCMYMLVIFQKFQNKVVKRDDPFQNSNILAFLMFCIVIQKYIVEYLFSEVVNTSHMAESTIVVIR